MQHRGRPSDAEITRKYDQSLRVEQPARLTPTFLKRSSSRLDCHWVDTNILGNDHPSLSFSPKSIRIRIDSVRANFATSPTRGSKPLVAGVNAFACAKMSRDVRAHSFLARPCSFLARRSQLQLCLQSNQMDGLEMVLVVSNQLLLQLFFTFLLYAIIIRTNCEPSKTHLPHKPRDMTKFVSRSSQCLGGPREHHVRLRCGSALSNY